MRCDLDLRDFSESVYSFFLGSVFDGGIVAEGDSFKELSCAVCGEENEVESAFYFVCAIIDGNACHVNLSLC